MIIKFNAAGTNAIRVLDSRQNTVNKTIAQLSSGERIGSAGDDPASFTVSEKLRGKISGLTAARQNAIDGLSLVQTAEGYLSSVQSLLSTAKALAVQSANGVYSDQDRANIQIEFDQIIKELDRIEGSAQFNGQDLLRGDFANANLISAGPAGTQEASEVGGASRKIGPLVLLVGVQPNDTVEVFIDAFRSETLGLKDIKIESSEGARQAIQLVDKAIDTTNRQRVELGSNSVRLNNVIESTAVAIENFKSAESNIRNTNIAEAISELGNEMLGDQVNVAMIGQANVHAQAVLRLL